MWRCLVGLQPCRNLCMLFQRSNSSKTMTNQMLSIKLTPLWTSQRLFVDLIWSLYPRNQWAWCWCYDTHSLSDCKTSVWSKCFRERKSPTIMILVFIPWSNYSRCVMFTSYILFIYIFMQHKRKHLVFHANKSYQLVRPEISFNCLLWHVRSTRVVCVWDSWLVAEKETLNFTECCWDTCIHTEDN